jgi:uncharacterized protein (DUF1697 family)
MTTYVAVLYSIVLPGAGTSQRLKMADLIDIATKLGLSEPRTHGATGNLIFETKKQKVETLEKKLEDAYEARFRKRVDIIVRTAADWKKMAESNPFPKESESDGSRVAVRIMRDRIPQSEEAKLAALCAGGEKVRIVDGDFWGYFALSPAGSRLLQATAREKQGIGTLRNANVVGAIAKLLG